MHSTKRFVLCCSVVLHLLTSVRGFEVQNKIEEFIREKRENAFKHRFDSLADESGNIHVAYALPEGSYAQFRLGGLPPQQSPRDGRSQDNTRSLANTFTRPTTASTRSTTSFARRPTPKAEIHHKRIAPTAGSISHQPPLPHPPTTPRPQPHRQRKRVVLVRKRTTTVSPTTPKPYRIPLDPHRVEIFPPDSQEETDKFFDEFEVLKKFQSPREISSGPFTLKENEDPFTLKNEQAPFTLKSQEAPLTLKNQEAPVTQENSFQVRPETNPFSQNAFNLNEQEGAFLSNNIQNERVKGAPVTLNQQGPFTHNNGPTEPSVIKSTKFYIPFTPTQISQTEVRQPKKIESFDTEENLEKKARKITGKFRLLNKDEHQRKLREKYLAGKPGSKKYRPLYEKSKNREKRKNFEPSLKFVKKVNPEPQPTIITEDYLLREPNTFSPFGNDYGEKVRDKKEIPKSEGSFYKFIEGTANPSDLAEEYNPSNNLVIDAFEKEEYNPFEDGNDDYTQEYNPFNHPFSTVVNFEPEEPQKIRTSFKADNRKKLKNSQDYRRGFFDNLGLSFDTIEHVGNDENAGFNRNTGFAGESSTFEKHDDGQEKPRQYEARIVSNRRRKNIPSEKRKRKTLPSDLATPVSGGNIINHYEGLPGNAYSYTFNSFENPDILKESSGKKRQIYYENLGEKTETPVFKSTIISGGKPISIVDDQNPAEVPEIITGKPVLFDHSGDVILNENKDVHLEQEISFGIDYDSAPGQNPHPPTGPVTLDPNEFNPIFVKEKKTKTVQSPLDNHIVHGPEIDFFSKPKRSQNSFEPTGNQVKGILTEPVIEYGGFIPIHNPYREPKSLTEVKPHQEIPKVVSPPNLTPQKTAQPPPPPPLPPVRKQRPRKFRNKPRPGRGRGRPRRRPFSRRNRRKDRINRNYGTTADPAFDLLRNIDVRTARFPNIFSLYSGPPSGDRRSSSMENEVLPDLDLVYVNDRCAHLRAIAHTHFPSCSAQLSTCDEDMTEFERCLSGKFEEKITSKFESIFLQTDSSKCGEFFREFFPLCNSDFSSSVCKAQVSTFDNYNEIDQTEIIESSVLSDDLRCLLTEYPEQIRRLLML